MFRQFRFRSFTLLFGLLGALLLMTAPAWGTGAINGIFGVRFGQTFNLAEALSTDTFTGHKVYEFSPSDQTPLFDRYYLSITPQTKRIYGICGVNSSATLERAKANYRQILDQMQQRYGQVESGLLSGIMNMFGLKRIHQGDHKIVISFREDSKKTYVIHYNDRLKEQAKIEEARQSDS